MKSFTAKQFNKAPADVYQAARDDGAVAITHDRFKGEFIVIFSGHDNLKTNEKIVFDHEWMGEFTGLTSTESHRAAQDMRNNIFATIASNIVDNVNGTISFRRPKEYEKAPEGADSDLNAPASTRE